MLVGSILQVYVASNTYNKQSPFHQPSLRHAVRSPQLMPTTHDLSKLFSFNLVCPKIILCEYFFGRNFTRRKKKRITAFSYLCSNNSWEELLIADGAILINGEVKVRVVPDVVGDLVVKTIFVSGFHLQERGACWRGRRGRGCSLQW